jgi:hypothetical protein
LDEPPFGDFLRGNLMSKLSGVVLLLFATRIMMTQRTFESGTDVVYEDAQGRPREAIGWRTSPPIPPVDRDNEQEIAGILEHQQYKHLARCRNQIGVGSVATQVVKRIRDGHADQPAQPPYDERTGEARSQDFKQGSCTSTHLAVHQAECIFFARGPARLRIVQCGMSLNGRSFLMRDESETGTPFQCGMSLK